MPQAGEAMTWTRLSDNFADRPDVLALSDAAFRGHVCALIWCNKQLTDGRVPARAVALFVADADVVAELVEHGLWLALDDGYQLDWSDQESAERVVERRNDNRRRDERRRLHNKGDHSTCDPKRCRVLLANPDMLTRGSRVGPPVSHALPSRPVPSRPLGRDEDEESASAPSARATGAQRSERKKDKPGPWDHLDDQPDPAPEPAPDVSFPGRGEDEKLSDYMRRVNLTPFVLVEDEDEDEQAGGEPA